MIITRTPYRVSFFGGGTDYRGWFEEHGGAVLSSTINRYCHITCRFLPPFFDHKSRIVWSRIESVKQHSEISHPVIRVLLDFLEIDQGVELHHDGDLPARSGLGSSSAFTVGTLHALSALQGGMVSKRQLADLAIHVEQKLLAENVGVQDQIATAFGGLNRIEIARDGSYTVQPLIISHERVAALEQHLMLFYTGVVRNASEIAGEQLRAIPQKHLELRRMRAMVDQAVDILASTADIGDFGRLLHESWMLKRTLSDKVSPPFVDDIYARGRAAGALGGKLLGAGGGGFMLLFAPPEHQQAIRSALGELLLVPIEFDRAGSQLIFYEQPRYSRAVREGSRQFERFEG